MHRGQGDYVLEKGMNGKCVSDANLYIARVTRDELAKIRDKYDFADYDAVIRWMIGIVKLDVKDSDVR